MPEDENMRKKWIDSIAKHQRLTSVDLATINFSVCSQHFKPEEVHRTKSRVSVKSYPTIFPDLDEVSDAVSDAISDAISDDLEVVVNPVEK